MNLKSSNVEQFKAFSNFESLGEFNAHFEMWLSVHKRKFTKGELIGLKRLARYAAKVPGVSNAKIGTVLKAIHEEYNGNGISRSTFKRMIVKAKIIGIFKAHETGRKNGSQSSNLYVFNRFPSYEPPKKEKMNRLNKTNNLIKTNKIKEINKRNENDQIENELDFTFTSDRVPEIFVKLVKCFFPDEKTIEEFWRMTHIAAYRNNCEQNHEQIIETSIHAFKQLISKMKSSKVIKPIAYYYGILENKFLKLFFEELCELGFQPIILQHPLPNNFRQ